MRIYWTNFLEKGNLGLMARPRGNDWLEDEILKLKREDVSLVVSLLESEEINDLEIEDEKKLCLKHDIDFINFPIKDRGVPNDLDLFVQMISKVCKEVNKHNKVVVHCRMGIGRTSIVAASILIKYGMSATEVFDFLTNIRTIEVPDTTEQVIWVRNKFASVL